MWVNYRRQVFADKKNRKDSVKTDYRCYKYSPKEWMIYGAEATIKICFLDYFFFRSLIWMIPMLPLFALFMKNKKAQLIQKRKQNLSIQFKDALTSINGALQAGYSLENAFAEAYKEMCRYHGPQSMIGKELHLIKKGMHNGQTIESQILDFGFRSGIEEILDFSTVLSVAKKSGGGIDEILQKNIGVIEEKMETCQEVDTLLSGKKMEAKIMSVIPFFIILYMDITSKGYFDPLYQTVGGNIIMTMCLGIYLTAMGISKKIVNIDV